jgi:hypothetical protein
MRWNKMLHNKYQMVIQTRKTRYRKVNIAIHIYISEKHIIKNIIVIDDWIYCMLLKNIFQYTPCMRVFQNRRRVCYLTHQDVFL